MECRERCTCGRPTASYGLEIGSGFQIPGSRFGAGSRSTLNRTANRNSEPGTRNLERVVVKLQSRPVLHAPQPRHPPRALRGALPCRRRRDGGSLSGPRHAPGSHRRHSYDLYRKSAGGVGAEELLLKSAQTKLPDDWSRDGRSILFQSLDPKTSWDVWILPLEGDRTPRPVVQTRFNELQGSFSPDGRWIAYVSDESGRSEVYVQSFPPSGGKWQISISGGVQPRWRAMGRCSSSCP